MEKIIKITSNQNPNIKQVIKLRTRKERNLSNLFLIEGYRELKRAIEGKEKIISLFYSPEHFLQDNEFKLIEVLSLNQVNVFECAKYIFEKISYRDRPDGLCAIAEQKRKSISDLEKILVAKENPFFLITENIEKPGNLGTILRSSDAAGVDAVLVCDPCTDIYNPNVVRASVGTLFTIPVITSTSYEVIALLNKYNVKILAATPKATQVYTEVDMKTGIGIAVGSEQYGLSDLWLKKAENKVSIPMKGVADSLNVATATTLLLYEVIRQRKTN
jgi:RNA methyltransferase, TrmH family